MDGCQKSAAPFFSLIFLQYAFFRRFCGGGGVAQKWLILCNCMRQQLYDSKAGKQAVIWLRMVCLPTRTPLKLPQENRANACHQHYYLRLSALCSL
jgi:hypothetical protein